MNFCPHCGSSELIIRIPEGDHKERWVCTQCESIHYVNPKIIVGCLPLWEGKVMIAKRGIEPRFGLWNLPCGFMETNETVEAGAVREVLEETGSEVELLRLHTVYNLLHEHQVYLIFLANMKSDHFQTTLESTEIGLFTEETVPWSEMAFNSSTFALRNYFEDVRTGNSAVHFGTYKRK
jgi:ADP-ribose pyrophosphatase YjhB (NUDIX family)